MKSTINIKLLVIALLLLCVVAPISFGAFQISFTLQTLVVFTIAALLPLRESVLAVLLYLILGGMGVPIYAGFVGGLDKLIGPTSGFLFGFLLTAWFVNHRLSIKEANFFNVLLTMFAAHFILIVPGFIVLYFMVPGVKLWPTFVMLIPGILLKSITAGLIVFFLKPRLG